MLQLVSCVLEYTYDLSRPQSSDVVGYDDYVEGVEPEETASLDVPIAKVSPDHGRCPHTHSGHHLGSLQFRSTKANRTVATTCTCTTSPARSRSDKPFQH